MRVLLLSKYGRLGASSRIRFYQYVPLLEDYGFSVVCAPLLDDGYLRNFYDGWVPYSQVFRSFLKRVTWLNKARQFDAIWAEKELLPWVPAIFELSLLKKSIPLIVDYDDAIFHTYDRHRVKVLRFILGKKITYVMRRADLIIAGNKYLANHALQAGAQRVELLPSVVDTARYVASPCGSTATTVTIGWIGSPTTAKYLRTLQPVLTRLAAELNIRTVAVGARSDQLTSLQAEIQPWAEETEVESIRGFDIGVMPLPDEPWERGKCGYKLIQYMACGLPVVASPVGVNSEIIQDGVNGFLARSSAEWINTLKKLALSSDLRHKLGREGRHRAETTFSIQAQAPRLAKLLRSVRK
jgi:glycosyltransferase involved in cell wall biosynthesis